MTNIFSTPYILKQTRDFSFVFKPIGWHSATLQNSTKSIESLFPKLFLAHRLDFFTSGVLIFAHSESSLDLLKSQWKSITKTYVAITQSPPKIGLVNFDIDAHHRRKVRVLKKNSGQHQTHILKVVPFSDKFAVLVRIMSGTRHQIRAHLAYLKSPIYGDELYGAPAVPLGGHYLHAYSVESPFFTQMTAPFPSHFLDLEDFKNVVTLLI